VCEGVCFQVRKQVSKVKVKSCEIFRHRSKKILGFGKEGFQSKSQTIAEPAEEKKLFKFPQLELRLQ